MAVFYERPERGWTAIPTELIHTTELGPVARLVLMHALSHRSDWEDAAWRMADALGVSRERVIKALHELRKTGHARKTSTVLVAGHPPRQGWDFAWPAFVEHPLPKSENPTLVDERPRGPKSGFPTLGEMTCSTPRSENPTMATPPSEQSKSENPTMAASPQVSPKVGFPDDGKTRRWENPTMAEPTMGNPTSENPTPLLDLSTNKTVVDEDWSQNKTYPPYPPVAERDRIPDPPRPVLYNFDDDDPVVAPPVTPKVKRPRAPRPDARKPKASYDYSPDFEQAWERYGRRGSKRPAFQEWRAILQRGVDPQKILDAIEPYRASCSEPQYVRHMERWLRDDGWDQEFSPVKKEYRAGSDALPHETYLEMHKDITVKQVLRQGICLEVDLARAWYYHWNHERQHDWTVEQIQERVQTVEDAQWLHDAYRDGIDPDLYSRFKRYINID